MIQPGEEIGAYVVVTRLAEDTASTLFLVRKKGDQGVGAHRAMRILTPAAASNAPIRNAFYQRARSTLDLNIPALVTPIEVAEHRGVPYVVSEFVHGVSMRQLFDGLFMTRRRLKPDVAVYKIALTLAQALDAAHDLTDASGNPKRLVHGLISPYRVVISFDGRVRLTSFGVVKPRVAGQTMPAANYGYMAPEIARHEANDTRADVFSLAVILWEALTMRRCFAATSEEAALELVKMPPAPPGLVVQGVPTAIDVAVMRGLADDPEQRPSSMDDFAYVLNLASPGARTIKPDAMARLLSTVMTPEVSTPVCRCLLGIAELFDRARPGVDATAFEELTLPIPTDGRRHSRTRRRGRRVVRARRRDPTAPRSALRRRGPRRGLAARRSPHRRRKQRQPPSRSRPVRRSHSREARRAEARPRGREVRRPSSAPAGKAIPTAAAPAPLGSPQQGTGATTASTSVGAPSRPKTVMGTRSRVPSPAVSPVIPARPPARRARRDHALDPAAQPAAPTVPTQRARRRCSAFPRRRRMRARTAPAHRSTRSRRSRAGGTCRAGSERATARRDDARHSRARRDARRNACRTRLRQPLPRPRPPLPPHRPGLLRRLRPYAGRGERRSARRRADVPTALHRSGTFARRARRRGRGSPRSARRDSSTRLRTRPTRHRCDTRRGNSARREARRGQAGSIGHWCRSIRSRSARSTRSRSTRSRSTRSIGGRGPPKCPRTFRWAVTLRRSVPPSTHDLIAYADEFFTSDDEATRSSSNRNSRRPNRESTSYRPRCRRPRSFRRTSMSAWTSSP